MTTSEVRTITGDELPAYLDAMTTSFLERMDVDKLAAEVKPFWDLERAWAAFDGARISGTFRSWETEITVPGGQRLPASAVAAVTVLPTHRRRGLLRAMAAAEHVAIRERGETFGLLYASEYTIYGRFGYGPACRVATWTLDKRQTGFHRAPSGTVEFAVPSPATRDTMKSVFEAWRMRSPGEIRRRDVRWDYDLALRPSVWGKDWKGWVIFHRDESGQVDGYVRYRGEEKSENLQPASVVNVDEMHALNDDAYSALWQFLAEMDLVVKIKAEGRSPAERLPWLITNRRAATASDIGDGLWVRIFDIQRALGARSYERSSRLVLEVIDESAPTGRVRVALDASPDGARCAETTESADLTVHVAALGAAYLGGTRLRDACLGQGVDEHRPGALAEADMLLRTADEPWSSTFF